MINSEFWPIALSYAKYIHNHPCCWIEFKTPRELFTDESCLDRTKHFQVVVVQFMFFLKNSKMENQLVNFPRNVVILAFL